MASQVLMKSGLNQGQDWCCGRKPKACQYSFIHLCIYPYAKIYTNSLLFCMQRGPRVHIPTTSFSIFCQFILLCNCTSFVLHWECVYMPKAELLHFVSGQWWGDDDPRYEVIVTLGVPYLAHSIDQCGSIYNEENYFSMIQILWGLLISVACCFCCSGLIG